MTNGLASRLEDFEEYRQAQELLADVQIEYTRCDQRVSEILTALAQPKPRRSPITEQAEALLAGTMVVEEVSPLTQELDELHTRRKVLTEAIRLQRQKVEELRAEYSRQACEQVKPAYDKIVARLALAVKELGLALDEERQFREQLAENRIEYASWIRPMPFPRVGGLADPSDPLSPAMAYLCEIARYYPEALPKGVVLPEVRPAGLGPDVEVKPAPPVKPRRKVDETEWATDA